MFILLSWLSSFWMCCDWSSFETCKKSDQTSSYKSGVVSSGTWRGSFRWRSKWLRSHPSTYMRSLFDREELMRQGGPSLQLYFLGWGSGQWWLDPGAMAGSQGEIEERVGWLSWGGQLAQRPGVGWVNGVNTEVAQMVRECRQKERWEAGYPHLPKMSGWQGQRMTARNGGGWNITSESWGFFQSYRKGILRSVEGAKRLVTPSQG